MSIEITSNGNTLGYADDASVRYGAQHHPGAYSFSAELTSSLSINLEGFSEADPDGVDYKELYYVRGKHYESLFEELIELREAYNRRGKTIETLTDTFTAKKERIHAFYAPQLENRKQELKELELTKEFAHRETLSANKWCTRAYELEDELHAERLRTNSLLDERRSRPQVSVDHSVIAEYEEQIGRLGRKVERLQKSLSATEAETYRQVDYKMHAWDEQVRLEEQVVALTGQLKELQDKSDSFVEAHVRAAHIINDSVVEWEETE